MHTHHFLSLFETFWVQTLYSLGLFSNILINNSMAVQTQWPWFGTRDDRKKSIRYTLINFPKFLPKTRKIIDFKFFNIYIKNKIKNIVFTSSPCFDMRIIFLAKPFPGMMCKAIYFLYLAPSSTTISPKWCRISYVWEFCKQLQVVAIFFF